MPEMQYFTHQLGLSAHSTPSGKQVEFTLAYKTFGNEAAKAGRAVLIPTCFGGTVDTELPFLYSDEQAKGTIGDGAKPVFDLASHFVVVANLIGGTESSSPSNMKDPSLRGADFPATSYEDNINMQHALCASLGITKLHAYVGFSMGGQQAYYMASMYPDFAAHVVCIATSARTSWHNWAFLEGPKAALVRSSDFQGGRYTSPAKAGTSAFGRVYCPWALSPEWFRQKSWVEAGFKTFPDYMMSWEEGLGGWDANDLLTLLQTWQKGNICSLFPEDGDDLAKSLGRIKAKVLVMPSRTDAYFPPEDSMEEVKHLRNGELKIIESIWGHLAGGGGGTKVCCRQFDWRVCETKPLSRPITSSSLKASAAGSTREYVGVWMLFVNSLVGTASVLASLPHSCSEAQTTNPQPHCR